MSIFRTILHFLEFLVRRLYLIAESNGNYFLRIFIRLEIEDFFCICKKPYLLFVLQCIRVLRYVSHRPLHSLKFDFLKENCKLISRTLKTSLSKESTPYYFQMWVNPVVNFFTENSGFEESSADESEDEKRDQGKESKCLENEKKMVETSDQFESVKSEDSDEMNIDANEVGESSSVLPATQKRKAEFEEGENMKRSKSNYFLSKDGNFENTSSTQSESQNKEDKDEIKTFPVQIGSCDKILTTSTSPSTESYELMLTKFTSKEIEKLPKDSDKSFVHEEFQSSEVNCDDTSQDTLRDSKLETVKLSNTAESPKFQKELEPSSNLKHNKNIEQDLSQPSQSSQRKARKSIIRKRLHSPTTDNLEDSEIKCEDDYREDTCPVDGKCLQTPSDSNQSLTHSTGYSLEGVLSIDLLQENKITSSGISRDEINPTPKLARKTLSRKKFRSLSFPSDYQSRSEDLLQRGSRDTACETVVGDDTPRQRSCPDKAYSLREIAGTRLSPKGYAHKKFRSSMSVPSDVPTQSEDSCQSLNEIRKIVKDFFATVNPNLRISHDTDSKLQQGLVQSSDPSSGISEENSRVVKVSISKQSLTDSSIIVGKATGISENDTKDLFSSGASDISKTDESISLNEGFESVSPPASPSLFSTPPPLFDTTSHENIMKFTQNILRGNCELTHNNSGYENKVKSGENFFCSKWNDEFGTFTTETAAGLEIPSDSVKHYDRPSTSRENDAEGENVPNYKTYPGLSLRPHKVKKDFRYQKKFYRQKKEITVPGKLEKIIQWAINKPQDLAHNIPEPEASDSDDKFPLEKYHEIAQKLTQDFLTAYDNAKKVKAKIKLDKEMRKEKTKQQIETGNAGYVKSSFIEESPPSDSTDSYLSLNSPKKSPSKGSTSPLPFVSNRSFSEISPAKTERGSFRLRNWEPIPFNLDESEFDIVTLSRGNSPPNPPLSSETDSTYPFQSAIIKLISPKELVHTGRVLYCRDTLQTTVEGAPKILRPLLTIEKVLNKDYLLISVEEFLQTLDTIEQIYGQMLFNKREPFYALETGMTVCIIPFRCVESHDDDYELDGDTLKLGSSLSDIEHTCMGQELRDLDEALARKLETQPEIELISCFRETRKYPSVPDNWKKPILISMDSPPTCKLGVNMKARGEVGAPETKNISEVSHVKTCYEDKVSILSSQMASTAVNLNLESGQCSELFEADLKPIVLTNPDTEQRIEIDVLEKVEIPTLQTSSDNIEMDEMFRNEQRAIMESLKFARREALKHKNRGEKILSTTREGIGERESISESQNISVENFTGQLFTCDKPETSKVKIQKDLSTSAEIALKEENISDNLKPSTHFGSTSHSLGLTQFPTIVNVSVEEGLGSEPEISYSPSSEEEIINREGNQPFYTSGTRSTSEKDVLFSDKRLELSPMSLCSEDLEDVDIFSKASADDGSEDTSSTISAKETDVDETTSQSQ